MIARMILALLIAAAPLSALGQTKGSPSFGTVAADKFIGPLQGNATSATTAGSATSAATATSATTAAAASTLTTPRTLTLSGDAACSFLFDGSANTGCTLTLAASGVTPGTYGSASAVPIVTVDAKGRITGISATPVSGGGGGGAVTSVAGRTGAVTLTSADLTDGTSLGRSIFTAVSAAAVRSAAAAAAFGANSDITSLAGLTTPLSVAQGGTGAATVSAARSSLGAAASGANTDITSLGSGVTGTTAAANDNSTKLATTAYADRSATNAVAGVPVAPPVRQTAISGPASAGAPSFLPASTSGTLTLTAQGVSSTAPLIITAAQGGLSNATYTFTSNPSWTLPASTTAYLFVNASSGATSVQTLAPIYQFGGAPSTAAGQFTFDWQAMIGYLGNGTTAVATPLVAVGEAVTSSTAVTSTIAYAYQGQYDSGWTAGLPNTIITRSHNLGVQSLAKRFIAENTTAENGYAVGDQISSDSGVQAAFTNFPAPMVVASTRLAATPVQGTSGTGWATINKSTAASVGMTLANWRWKLVVQRGW